MSSFSSAGDSERELQQRDRRNNDGDEDEADLDEEEQQSIITGIFGVIYTVSRERTATKKFFAFKMILDLWQLLTLILNPAYGWNINSDSTGWYIFTLVQMNQFMQDRGLAFFLACFYIFVVLLMITVAICVWVVYSFRNKHFDQVWPIAFLRWFGIIFFQMLEIAAMNLILIVLNCQYFGGDPAKNFIQWEFGVYIFQMPYMINVVVAVVALILFTILSVLFQMGEMELNMVTKNLLGMANSRTEVMVFLVKFLMTTSSVFLYPGMKWLSAVYAVSSYLLVYLSVMWAPYYYSWVNYVRSATYGAVLYSACMLLLLVFTPGVNLRDLDAVKAWQTTCTIAMCAGLVPAGLAAAALTYARIRYYRVTVVNRFRNATADTKVNKIHKFSNPLEVELASRHCRNWVDDDVLDPEAVRVTGKIIEAGQHQLPGNAYMIILYSNYLIDVQGSYQTGLMELREAKKADPSFLERFAIFCREQQHTQKSTSGKGKINDLVSYVEQQRNYRLALKVHKESLQATSNFWRSLIAPRVMLEEITEAVCQFDECVKHAEATYKNMLQQNPENWRLMRMYAKFVEFIKNDPWGAAKWVGEAERLWQVEEDDKHNLFSEDNGDGKDSGVAQMVKTAMEDTRKAVVVVNAYGIIGMANKAACSVFGYDIRGIRGKNVKMLIPSPFAEQHDGWLRTYVTSSRSSEPLSRYSSSVALHRDRYVFGINLHYTKISGTGMDMMFLGIMEPLPVPEDTAFIWVLTTGAVISCDQSCYDWFGYDPKELPGTRVSRLVKEEKAIDEALKLVLAKDVARKELRFSTGNKDGSSFCLQQAEQEVVEDEMDPVHIETISFKHKYASQVKCSLDITFGGFGQQGMFILKITRSKDASQMMMVTDRRGQLCHISKDIATELGYTVPQLLGDMAATVWDTVLPEPFARLHRVHVAQDLPLHRTEFSCRSGLTVFMSAITGQGPELKPYKIKVETRRLEGLLDKCNVVTLQSSSMEQALDERCMSVMINEDGVVTRVSNCSVSLFGFDPMRMLGRSIDNFVDVFKSDALPVQHVSPASLGEAEEEVHTSLQEMIVELSRRYLETPAASYRVGVNMPVDLHSTAPASKHGNSLLEKAVTKAMEIKGMCPAVMEVKLHMTGNGVRDPASVGGGSLMSRRWLSSGDGMAAASSLNPSTSSMLLELRLWKANLLAGVLQLDASSGEIIGTTDVPFCQPGLLLGVDSDALIGRNIGDVLPDMRDQSVHNLFLKDFGLGPKEKKGGLKKEHESGKRQKLPGPVTVTRAAHLVDRQELSLAVQAVHKGNNSRGSIFVVLHINRPSLGMLDFSQWLQVNSSARAGGSAAAAAALRSSPRSSVRRLASPHAISQYKLPATSMQRLRFNEDSAGQLQGPSLGRSAAAVPLIATMDEEGRAPLSQLGSWSGLEHALEELAYPTRSQELRSSKRVGNSAGSNVIDDKPGFAKSTFPLASPAAVLDRTTAWVASDGGSQHDVLVSMSRVGSTEDQHMMEPLTALQANTNDDDISDSKGGNAPCDDDAASYSTKGEKFEIAADLCDYRRGRRFKRVTKLLTGESTKRRLRRFKYQAYGVAVFVLAVTVCSYIMMLFLLANQEMLVSSLNTIGHAADSASHMYISTLSLASNYMNRMDPGLPLLTSTKDIAKNFARLNTDIGAFQENFRKAYYDIMDMPNKYGLHEKWTDATTTIDIFLDKTPGSPAVRSTANYSVWDAGNLYTKAALGIYQNGAAYNLTVKSMEILPVNGTTWLDNPDAMFIRNNMEVVTDELFSSLDIVVEIVIDSTLLMNEIQYVFLAIEGVVCSTMVILFVAYITTQLATNRWILYNVFMMVPVGLTKALANKTLILEDGEQPPISQEVPITVLAGSAGKGALASTFKMSITGSLSKAGSILAWLRTACSSLMFWRKRSAAISPVYAKRQLVYTRRSVYLMCSMFLAWGVMMIAINAAGHSALAKVSGPTALFNLVNFVYVRHMRTTAWVMELAMQNDPEQSDILRDKLSSRFILPFDYLVMLQGVRAAPGKTQAHFTLATSGVADVPEGRQILYELQSCMRVDQTTCLVETDPLYQYTMAGLNMVMQHFFTTVNTCLAMRGADPNFSSPQFRAVWNTRRDINGGLVMINKVFYQKVVSVYSNTLMVHTVGLVMTIVFMFIYIFLILRPLLKSVTGEIKRIAELLNQLPTEVDVETLVRKTQQMYQQSRASTSGDYSAGLTASGVSSSDALGLSQKI